MNVLAWILIAAFAVYGFYSLIWELRGILAGGGSEPTIRVSAGDRIEDVRLRVHAAERRKGASGSPIILLGEALDPKKAEQYSELGCEIYLRISEEKGDADES